MCTGDDHEADAKTTVAPGPSRRRVLNAAALTAATTAAAGMLVGTSARARAAAPATTSSRRDPRLSLTLLGTAAGPPPLAARFGISSALVVNGRTYVVDCGRGSVSQFMRAGLSMPSLAGIFLTHLHADHTVDYFSYPLLSAGVVGAQGFQQPIDVYGPASGGLPTATPPPGQSFVLPDRPAPGTAELTQAANLAWAQSTDFFLSEHVGVNPVTMLRVHEVSPPLSAQASQTRTAPPMAPFPVMENQDIRVTAILVPHGAVYPAYAYRFDTDHGSVVFSGDTAPTPNIPTLAHGADLLVHEAADFDALSRTGYPPAALAHIRAVHTDVGLLGSVAREAEVGGLVLTHFTPADPALAPHAVWEQKLHATAAAARYRGQLTVGEDLLDVRWPTRRR
jgi:ribonuclease BN (tRNA processing enzyme)